MIYNKLIRDRIPEIIKKDDKRAIIKKLSKDSFERELRKKLIEEAVEVRKADNREDLVKEIADVEEILLSLLSVKKIKRTEVVRMRNKRKKERGGFNKRIFLKEVIAPKKQ